MSTIKVQAVPSNTNVTVQDANNINVNVNGGNQINLKVTSTPTQTVQINRGVVGNGIASVSIYYDGTTYYLDFLYTDGTNELVPLPSIAAGVASFNTRVGAVTLTLSDVTTALGYTPPTPTGTGATGTWAISVSGNAATVTNGVVTTGTYADPLWITALSASKITGTLTNSQLANSSININGTPVSLGGSVITPQGTITSVTGTSPIASSGGATPAISILQAGSSTNGYLSSADWNTFNNKGNGTVTNVAAIAGTGISISGSPITTTGTLNITNTAPDQIVSLTGAGTTTVTGTYPSFTITSTGGGGDVTGAALSIDNAITRFDGTTGKVIQNSTVTLDDNGNIINANSLNLDTTPATVPATAGTMSWDDGEGIPSVLLKGGNTELKVGAQEYARVYNDSGVALTKGQVVYISGAQGNRIAVKLAKANVEATSFGTIGFVTESIAIGGEGYIIVSGALYKLNTTGFTAGAAIYLSPTTAGAYTLTKPQAPNQLVILGYVERVDNNVGSIYVKVDNGYELDELHDVLITTPISGNTLIYDAVAGVWKNANLTDGTGITITEGAGSITVANSGVLGITATSPVASSGGQNPVISMPAATTSVSGYLTSTDWNTFNNKSNTTGTVTSVAATAGTGISITGSPITTNGTFNIINTAPDQIVSLTAGSNITVTGTYPSFTIASSGGGGMTYPTGTGIAVVTGGTSWGTTLTAPTGAIVGTTDTQTLTDKTLTDPAIIGTITEDIFTITDNAAFEIDPANGSIQTVTLGANRTPAATNFTNGKVVLLGINDGTAFTITWTTVAVTWVKAGGSASAPTLATTGFTWVLLWEVGGIIYGTLVGSP